jgi:hypothetical protein
LFVALGTGTLKHIWDVWSRYTHTSEPVADYGANMITDHPGRISTNNLSVARITEQTNYCTTCAHERDFLLIIAGPVK